MLQKQAFKVLLTEKDLKHQRIRNQILLVEQELSRLSQVEMEQRKMKIDSNMVCKRLCFVSPRTAISKKYQCFGGEECKN